jgi:hypothetical protein
VKKHLTLLMMLAATALIAAQKIAAQTPPPAQFSLAAEGTSYADIADLVVMAPLILDVQVKKVTQLPPTQTVGVPTNIQRVLVEADVLALIRGSDGFAAKSRFLLDLPRDAKNKVPKITKRRFFVLGSKVAGKPGDVRLARPDSLIDWSASNDATLRAVTQEAVQINAPQAIAGVTSAFHSSGTVLGEGETQIFLRTAGGEPISINVLSRPGQAKKWAVSTGDLIDENAGAPPKNTLLWYRLACGLPRTLDPKLVESSAAEDVGKAQADYRFVIDALGPCGRQRRA